MVSIGVFFMEMGFMSQRRMKLIIVDQREFLACPSPCSRRTEALSLCRRGEDQSSHLQPR